MLSLAFLVPGCTGEGKREAIKPPVLYPKELLGSYLLQVGPAGQATQQDARWCYLEIAAKEGEPHRLTGKVWRPDEEQTISCTEVGYSRSGLTVQIKRSYSTEKVDVEETWRLKGALKRPAAQKPEPAGEAEDEDEDAAGKPVETERESFLAGDAAVITVVTLPEQEETRNKTRRLRFTALRDGSDADEALERLEAALDERERQEAKELERLARDKAATAADSNKGRSP